MLRSHLPTAVGSALAECITKGGRWNPDLASDRTGSQSSDTVSDRHRTRGAFGGVGGGTNFTVEARGVYILFSVHLPPLLPRQAREETRYSAGVRQTSKIEQNTLGTLEVQQYNTRWTRAQRASRGVRGRLAGAPRLRCPWPASASRARRAATTASSGSCPCRHTRGIPHRRTRTSTRRCARARAPGSASVG